jgi:cyclopropane-fatty-acyl-phospholipid synthase
MTSSATLRPTPSSATQTLPRAARICLKLLEHLSSGTLTLVDPAGGVHTFGQGHPQATIRVQRWDMFEAVLKRGDIGFAQAWIEGQWNTDALADLLGLMVANRQVLEKAVYGTWYGQLFDRIRHLLNRNTKTGSRRNIHAHYDLGNDFYRLWLDETMTYSSALFGGDERRSLADAQRAKNARLLQEISVAPGARVLEIGCGWGGFAETAARAGLEIHGLTLSTEQLAYANARLQRAGLAQRGRLRLQDYRDEQGQYDAIVSVEMFEAVGEAYWPAYFQTLRRCLKPGGRAAIQTITIADAYFERYRRGTDFIQQYVFPGGMLPSPSRFEALAHAAGLTVVKRFAFGRDYARTLALWREVFMSKLPQVREQGFDQRFIRIWEFYLAYCEAAFRHDSTDVYQYTLQLPA